MFYFLHVYFHYNHISSKGIGIIFVNRENLYFNPTKLITLYGNIVYTFFETSKNDSDRVTHIKEPQEKFELKSILTLILSVHSLVPKLAKLLIHQQIAYLLLQFLNFQLSFDWRC